jgi:hypothetical protein
LPVALYGSETWSLTLREEHRLRLYENRVLKMFASKRDNRIGDWRGLDTEELHSPVIIRMMEVKEDEIG